MIINPNFKIQSEDKNIFTIRSKEYEKILPTVKQIVKPVENIGFQIAEVSLKDSREALSGRKLPIQLLLVFMVKT